MERYAYFSNSPEETAQLATKLANLLKPGDVLTLEGDLGAGKTTFTKALAKGLGIKKTVNSPTFTIIKEYTEGRLPFYHMDVYRIEDGGEDLGFEEYFESDGVTVVEWAHLIEEQLPSNRLDIAINYIESKKRNIIFTPYGKRFREICKELWNDDSISH
ncbi:tRNA (adenosine(37)-N6)-threonylcarbamoyltransferase complex ATPase subunit type 1 TsaE [Aeribacillus alveayuensis]|uniref:tRNA threonylcarbamoyladenosine biosynthesis protein TsaE n=1 Tax=Aeribacillus alveayuensis TaxID=279215 RepID=A0ABT9VRR8_9BACI|nr:tRNA threonylcarbamoyladenosine biosynthesis protein TsaE [Bacillus alveayuensis]